MFCLWFWFSTSIFSLCLVYSLTRSSQSQPENNKYEPFYTFTIIIKYTFVVVVVISFHMANFLFWNWLIRNRNSKPLWSSMHWVVVPMRYRYCILKLLWKDEHIFEMKKKKIASRSIFALSTNDLQEIEKISFNKLFCFFRSTFGIRHFFFINIVM